MATPVISLATGTYVMSTSTTITDLFTFASPSIKWCYAAAGTCTPATLYAGSIGVAASETICANATASGYAPSSTVCNSYTAQAATPAIALATGSYVMPQSTTVTDSTLGASILWCYAPTGNCTPATSYTGSIGVATSETICVNAMASGYAPSSTVCNSYTAQTATPAIALATGTYVMPQSTKITDSTSGAPILWCYTATGSCTPATSYTASIYLNPASTETICASAMASGYSQSIIVCNSYTPAIANPVIALTTGTYVMPQNTPITDSTSGASILWCNATVGSCTPVTPYTASVSLNPTSTETICAYATAPGYTQSSTVCNSYTAGIANPVITLASGAYTMPQTTTITDSTSGSSIMWCDTTTGSCTPATSYTASISLNPTSTETICAYATAPGYAQSGTVCNSYVSGSYISFTYSQGQVTMSTLLQGAGIFYTLDGSTATEGSIEYIPGVPVTVAPGTTINAVAVQMTSGGNTAVTVQNGQATQSAWKTVLASSSAQSAPYVSLYNTPHLDYGSGASGGDDGVQGIPTAIGMVVNQSLPSAIGGGTTTNFNMTTENLSGAGSGLQVLWPYDSSGPTGDGCDSCTSMIEDFYIWPQYTASINPANVENWELDMNSWKLGDTYGYLGASFQCSILDGGWQYNGQSAPGWTNLSSTGFSSMTKINHDCQFPFGTLSADITSGTQQNFSVTPNVTGSVTAATVEPGMIVLLDNEEILCTASSGNTCTASQRGWAGTTAVTHAAGALYSGSVHVQYHVTFKPGDTSVCMINGKSGTAVECVFIDYLIVNNVKYDFHSIYGTQTVGGVAGYSALTNPAYTYTYPVDRAFDQKQIDVKSGIGSPSAPAEVGEFIDMDNVTASFGVIGSQSYVVP
jgi:Chitobiase/beta-hexosaminidase C-terminal domain